MNLTPLILKRGIHININTLAAVRTIEQLGLNGIVPKGSFFSLDISQLKQLKLLSLDDNWLSKIPVYVYQLPRLNFLSVSNNTFFSISNDIKRLEQLRYVILQGNKKLHTLPRQFYKLPNLEHIDVRDTGLASTIKDRIKSTYPNATVMA